jgi:hypothetical protein
MEERTNREIMTKASEMVFEFLRDKLPIIDAPHLLAEIGFASHPNDKELGNYFANMKERWTFEFMTLPLVETPMGRLSAQEAVFLDLHVISDVDADTLHAINNIARKYYHNLPSTELSLVWSETVEKWGVDSIEWVNFTDIAKKVEQDGTISAFKKDELLLLYKAMISKGEGDLFSKKALTPNIKGVFKRQGELREASNLPDELMPIGDAINPEISDCQVDLDFISLGREFERFGKRDYKALINTSLNEHIISRTRMGELPREYVAALMQYACIIPSEDSKSIPQRVLRMIAEHEDIAVEPIVIPSSNDDNLDVRTGWSNFFKIYLNDISLRDGNWVEQNIETFSKILTEAFGNEEVKDIFLKHPVFPNQMHKLKSITDLYEDDDIPDLIKDLFDKVVEPNDPIRGVLAHPLIANIHEDMKSKNEHDLTREIEQRFFGESGNEIHIDNHDYRSEIIDIVQKMKQDESYYAKLFPATFRNRSNIMVQLADGEDSFAILSQNEQTIKKLAQIATHPDLDDLLRLGQEAIDRQRHDTATLQRKKQLGIHLEQILRSHLSQNVRADIMSEQNGQDLVIYVEDQPIYYIEVKSKWLDTTPVRLTRNQTLQAYRKKDRFALCTIDMTKCREADKFEVKSIESVVNCMWFNTDVGEKVGHLVDVYDADARQEDEFRLDGDYRTHIPYRYITGEGVSLSTFEERLLSCIKGT